MSQLEGCAARGESGSGVMGGTTIRPRPRGRPRKLDRKSPSLIASPHPAQSGQTLVRNAGAQGLDIIAGMEFTLDL